MTTFKKELEEVFERFGENVYAVYLGGSHLNNLNYEGSDVDLTVVLKTNKQDLVFGNFQSGHNHGENDYKYVDTYKFAQLMYKTNPNFLELVFKKPLYVAKEYEPVANFLYEKRNELVKMNSSRQYSSSYHMMENNLREFKKDFAKGRMDKLGKKVTQFYKAYYQLKAVHANKELTPFVRLEGELQQELFAYKMMTDFTQEQAETMVQQMEEKAKEASDLNQGNKNAPFNQELFDEYVALL